MSENEEKEKILERVCKLFALADSSRNPSEEEVFAALTAAKKLMAQHTITESEIKEKEGKQKESWSFGRKTCNTSSKNRIRQWQVTLAQSTAVITETRVIQTEKGYR